MSADLATLRQKVLEATSGSIVGSEITDVDLEPDHDDQGTEFLRVVVQLKNSRRSTDEDFEALIEAIEKAVADVDDRYPSVRFADAA